MTDLRETMTVRDLADFLNYKTPKSVYALIHRDADFPEPFKLGVATLFFKDEIIEWQAKRIERASQNRIKFEKRASYGG